MLGSLVRASIRRRPLAWAFHVLSLALGVAVVVALLAINTGLDTRFARDLDGPRTLRVAPNGDIFVAETAAGTIRLLRAKPGATPAEYRAGLAWTLRSALNVAALQCQFEPTLNSVETYNAILKDHDKEFDGEQATLQKYYARMPGAGRATAGKGSKPGQAGFDQFGTRTYSAFSAVAGQYGFCQTAAGVAREALFAPRGTFADLAEKRVRLLRNSLAGAYGDEALPGGVQVGRPTTPRLDPICYDKKGAWVEKKCGPSNWPPAS